MSEQHAHPVALKAGDKVLVEAECRMAGLSEYGNIRVQILARQGLQYFGADPATVHPASLLDELRKAKSDLAKLSDPAAVRASILRGTIAIPDDLVWLHDTNGPVAELRAKLAAAEYQAHDKGQMLETDRERLRMTEDYLLRIAQYLKDGTRGHENEAAWEHITEGIFKPIAELRKQIPGSVEWMAANPEKVEAFLNRVSGETKEKSDHPQVCPVTNRPFFVVLNHPELGDVATYGGPFDSYTIPAWDIEDQEFRSERFDHDAGEWVEGGEPYGIALIDEQKLLALDEIADLRAKLAAAEAENNRLTSAYNIQYGQLWQARESGDAARRELREALEWMREDERKFPTAWTQALPHHDAGRAILARHEREERRKGERRGLYSDLRIASDLKRRKPNSDRRKPQPEPVDWQAKFEEESKTSQILLEAAQAECERLKQENDSLSRHNKSLMKDAVERSMEICREENHNKVAQVLNILTGAYRYHAIPELIAKALGCSITPLDEDAAIRQALQDAAAALTRAEQAEKKLEKVREIVSNFDMTWPENGVAKIRSAIDSLDSPAPPAQVEPWRWSLDRDDISVGLYHILLEVRNHIEALEAQKARQA